MYRRAVLAAGAAALGGGVLAGGVRAQETDAPQDDFGPLGTVDVAGAAEAVVGDPGTVYVATHDGYAVVDATDPTRPRLLARRRDPLVDRADGPLRDIQDLAVDGDRLLVAGPAHRQSDTLAGALVVDISAPGEPRAVAFHETSFPVHNCDLAGGHAYLTGNDGAGNPLVVVDVRGDDPVEVGRWALWDHDPAWADVSPAVRTLHDVRVQDGVAALALWDAGTWLVDVSEPAEPTALGTAGGAPPDQLAALSGGDLGRAANTLPGNDHYAAANADGTLLGVGREAWATPENPDGGAPGGIDLYDVSDPTDPARVSTIAPPATADATFEGTWTTAHNFQFHEGRLYSSWYQGGVKRHDVTDPAAPEELTWWRDPDRARFWTAQVALPDEAFVATHMGLPGTPPSLYVFPDADGSAGASPPLSASAATPTGTAGSATASAQSGRAPASPDPPTTDERGSRPDTATPAAVDGAGLGVPAGAATLAVAAWVARRRS